MTSLTPEVEGGKHANVDPTAPVTILKVNNDFLKIKLPCRMQISGPTLSGKSELILNFIKFREDIFDKKLDRIIYSLPHDLVATSQEYMDRLQAIYPRIEIVAGLPSLSKLSLYDKSEQKMIFVDDQIAQLGASHEILDIFLKNSHHNALSIGENSSQLNDGKYLFFNYFSSLHESKHLLPKQAWALDTKANIRVLHLSPEK